MIGFEFEVGQLFVWGSVIFYEVCLVLNVLLVKLCFVWLGVWLVGCVYFVLVVFGDNFVLYWVLVNVEFGEVIVVDVYDVEYGYWGEVMVVQVVVVGLVGFVIVGGVCDIEQQCEFGFFVFFSLIIVCGMVKCWVGVQGELIVLGGVIVWCGDLVVGDVDGVVVVGVEVFDEIFECVVVWVVKEECIMVVF